MKASLNRLRPALVTLDPLLARSIRRSVRRDGISRFKSDLSYISDLGKDVRQHGSPADQLRVA
jgi:hypothetical protein